VFGPAPFRHVTALRTATAFGQSCSASQCRPAPPRSICGGVCSPAAWPADLCFGVRSSASAGHPHHRTERSCRCTATLRPRDGDGESQQPPADVWRAAPARSRPADMCRQSDTPTYLLWLQSPGRKPSRTSGVRPARRALGAPPHGADAYLAAGLLHLSRRPVSAPPPPPAYEAHRPRGHLAIASEPTADSCVRRAERGRSLRWMRSPSPPRISA